MLSITSNPRVFTIAGAIIIVTLALLFFFTGLNPSNAPPSFSFGGINPTATHRYDFNDVLNQTLGFQKIFVINLRSRTDKRDSMTLAAALSGIQVEFVDGVVGDTIDSKTLPPGGKALGMNGGGLGSWRAHMNAVRMVVEQNLTSALILEDDADWDIRIKQQMNDFARASRLLVQPLKGTQGTLVDPTFPEPPVGAGASDYDLGTVNTTDPISSPYGDVDRWDVLWLGHCGTHFPPASQSNAKVPLGRAVIRNDQTVPEPQHIDMQFGDPTLKTNYPPHTRVVSRAWDTTCSLGYALSQPGARRVLWELGLRKMSAGFDNNLRDLCDGHEQGRGQATCLSVQPQLFQHHRPIGDPSTFSDISQHDGEPNSVAFTRNVRWSVRLNFEKLINVEQDYIDLFQDGQPADQGLGFRK